MPENPWLEFRYTGKVCAENSGIPENPGLKIRYTGKASAIAVQ
jgi:hypothetical protein